MKRWLLPTIFKSVKRKTPSSKKVVLVKKCVKQKIVWMLKTYCKQGLNIQYAFLYTIPGPFNYQLRPYWLINHDQRLEIDVNTAIPLYSVGFKLLCNQNRPNNNNALFNSVCCLHKIKFPEFSKSFNSLIQYWLKWNYT